MDKYAHIINLPHHVSINHRPMPLRDRAAQFSPFKAMVGLEDEIEETARITTERVELSDEQIEQLNKIIHEIEEVILTYPQVEIVYFVPDSKKQGGSYQTIEQRVKRVDNVNHFIQLLDGKRISFIDILVCKIIHV